MMSSDSSPVQTNVTCPQCEAKVIHSILGDEHIITPQCRSCEIQWYECFLCSQDQNRDPRQHVIFNDMKIVKRHNKRYHRMADTTIESNIAFTQTPNQPDDDEHFQHDDTSLSEIEGQSICDDNIIHLRMVDRFWLSIAVNSQTADLSVLPNSKYQTFYANQQRNLGGACLINRSQNGIDITAPLIVPREVLMHLRIAELIILLPKTKKRKLASIFEGIEDSTSY
jgi:hypothetical protein